MTRFFVLAWLCGVSLSLGAVAVVYAATFVRELVRRRLDTLSAHARTHPVPPDVQDRLDRLAHAHTWLAHYMEHATGSREFRA